VQNLLSEIGSAVTETVPELETAVFRQNRWEPKLRVFGAKWIWFRLPTLCLYMVQSQWVGSGEET